MQVLAFVNMKGGVAKTTLSVNIAIALSEREEKRVLLIDLDPQFNATQALVSPEDYAELRKKQSDTIRTIFKPESIHIDPIDGAQTTNTKSFDEIEVLEISENLDLIPGDLRLYELDSPSGQGVERRLKRFLEDSGALEQYDFVLIDTPPTPSIWMAAAIIAAEGYVVPVKPEPLSRVGVDLLRGVLNRLSENHGVSPKNLGVVLTMTEENTIVYKEARKFFGNDPFWKGKLFTSHLPKRTKIARDQGQQLHILDSDQTDARLALTRITKELLERCNGN